MVIKTSTTKHVRLYVPGETKKEKEEKEEEERDRVKETIKLHYFLFYRAVQLF